jgi:uncharacterized protein (TIGR03032 family)
MINSTSSLASPMPSPEVPPKDKNSENVAVQYRHSANLPELLTNLDASVLITTYQAGQVVSLGVHDGKIQGRFTRFDRAMGLTRTPRGLTLGTQKAIWHLPADRGIAAHIQPKGECDIAFLTRSCHLTGPLMSHDLAHDGEKLWIVNTLFNCLATMEGDWNFVPQWKPPFIAEYLAGDRCHLNGLAMSADGRSPAYVTTLGDTDRENGWRDQKATGGCLIDVGRDKIVLRGLSMPHSPRIYQGELYFLNSGHGCLNRYDPAKESHEVLATLPGFTRGLDIWAGHAFIGLSRIRETAVFSGLPIEENQEPLKCGLGIVNLATGKLVGTFWFESGVEEVFAVTVLPGYHNPVLIGPDTELDGTQTIWIVPPVASLSS